MRDEPVLSIWVDNRGNVHDEAEAPLADMIEAQPHHQLAQTAVEVLFWATISERPGSDEILVRIAASAKPATVKSIIGRLERIVGRPVAVAMWDERQRWIGPVAFPSATWACVFLRRWYEERGVQPEARAVDFEPVEYELDGEVVRDNRAVAFWRSLAGQQPLRMGPALRLSGLDRDSVALERGADGEWRISVLNVAGFAFWFYPRAWRMFAVQQVIQAQPDREFGRWMQDQVTAADRAGRPRWMRGTAYVRARASAPATCVRDELIFSPFSDGQRRSVVVTFERSTPLFAAVGA